ncbi:MAG: aldehyde dehydrogenase family protein [Planctomycetes bacterium]|nr:aldehyde dehydrogenase family protein [Planctomycetota bacterium]MCB9918482.1 aldehyde dehydrogenase family protein [Planctomycetota bacterium]
MTESQESLSTVKAGRPKHPFAEAPTHWDYAPSLEDRSLARLESRTRLFIDGQWRDTRRRFPTIDPSTEETLAEVALAGPKDVDDAVTAARRALPKWAGLPGGKRAKLLFAVARILQERSREFAVLETLDNGKPIRESRDFDVVMAAQHFFYYAGWADKLDYAVSRAAKAPAPIGVCGQIIPWNFPLLMAAWKLAPALAVGCTCILKPAETTPLTAIRLCEIFQEAGIPPGVVNVVTGAGKTGQTIVQHPDIDKIAFTGSTEVGKEIQRSVAGTRKRLSLELGGKAAHIIFEDAPLDEAVEGIVQGIWFNQGQVCCAGSRLFVQESVEHRVLELLDARMRTIRVGNPLDKNTDLGALNSREQFEKVQQWLAIGEEEGATRRAPEIALPSKGYWCAPTLLEHVTPTMRVAQEEIFGPVLAVLTFRTPDEAIAKANNSLYGLSAGVWTDKGSKVFDTIRRLRAGVVWGNCYNRFDASSPFGGYKESGFGREGGLHGLHPYLASS